MSSTEVQRPVKVHDSCVKSVSQDSDKHQTKRASFNSGIPTPKKNKHDDGRFKFGRKRAQSFTAGNGKFFIPYKKRKREGIVPPTKFLLGGNIFDPLNLNSLQDEEINRAMNAVTPKSSPLPTPKHRKGEIEVIIPPNINDPLNLIDCGDDDAKYEEQLVSPTKKKSKKKKKKRNSSSSKDDSLEVAVPVNTIDISASSVKTENNESQVPTNINIESVTTEDPQPLIAKGKEVRDLRKELDLPLKDDDKKQRKSVDDSSKDPNKNEKKNRKFDLKDKIVSPVIPQPGAWKRQPHGHRGGGNQGHGAGEGRFNRFRPGGWHRSQNPGLNIQKTPKFQEKNVKFQYGNYNRYYGYRNPSHEVDPRIKYFQQKREIFYDKDVLDIGCNIGHVTLTIARDFGAKSVVGLDIDRSLVEIARVNVRHYVNYNDSPAKEGAAARFFPISMPILYGPIDIPGITKSDSPSGHKKFPHNVSFVQGNYVLDSDVLLQTEQPQFDVILALSITKWIHLNWGDAGLKRAFKRMFLQLRPGGKLVLEAQAWDSYKKKKKLTETIFKHFNSIQFLPDKFTQYLLSSEVGFSKCEVIGLPFHQSRGFQRPIQLFTKGESPSHSVLSTSNTPGYASGANSTRVPVYTSVVTSTRESDSGSATPAPMVTPGRVEVTSNVNCVPVYTPVAVPELGSCTDDSKGKAAMNSFDEGTILEATSKTAEASCNEEKAEAAIEFEDSSKMECTRAENFEEAKLVGPDGSLKMECDAEEVQTKVPGVNEDDVKSTSFCGKALKSEEKPGENARGMENVACAEIPSDSTTEITEDSPLKMMCDEVSEVKFASVKEEEDGKIGQRDSVSSREENYEKPTTSHEEKQIQGKESTTVNVLQENPMDSGSSTNEPVDENREPMDSSQKERKTISENAS